MHRPFFKFLSRRWIRIGHRDLRQVPDTQEVFLYPDSSVSIVVEILQRVDKEDDEEAARFHFASIAHDNDAQSAEVYSVLVPPASATAKQTPPAVILYGTQQVTKFNAQTPDKVDIFLGLFRIKEKRVDLVVTFNVPTQTLAQDTGAVKDKDEYTLRKGEFESFIESLTLVDMALFA